MNLIAETIPPSNPDKADFKVIEYTSIDSLFNYLSEFSGTPIEVLRRKNHYDYFSRYFEHEKLARIIVECSYIDKDYLDDFATYYVRSFQPYQKTCARLHFFTSTFSTDDFKKILDTGTGAEILTDPGAYIGSMIVKPIPNACIGKTTLKHYGEKKEEGRGYPITRKYVANLFGIELEVRSLAFQEQDKSVSACATSALWSVFQGTGMLFHHSIPSPVHITEAATQNFPAPERKFPSNGLNVEMMAQAIRSVGLEPYQIEPKDYHQLKGHIYAFIEAKIPVVLGIALYETPKDYLGKDPAPASLLGLHSVAVTGYNLTETKNLNCLGDGLAPFRLKSSKMGQIYVHDDQLGPFAKMVFEIDDRESPQQKTEGPAEEYGKQERRPKYDIPVFYREVPSSTERMYKQAIAAGAIAHPDPQILSTTWKTKNGSDTKIIAQAKMVIIPLHSKIRIPFKDIWELLMKLNSNIFHKTNLEGEDGKTVLVWDIKLNWVNDIKTELLKEQTKQPIDKLGKILSKPLPKYIWRCILVLNETPLLELWFDATDIVHGNNYLGLIPRHKKWVSERFKTNILPQINIASITDTATRIIIMDIKREVESI